MKILFDYELYFTEQEWKSFPQKLQDKLFGPYREYVNLFENKNDETELDNSIKISLEDFNCAWIESEIEDGEFERWLEDRNYHLPHWPEDYPEYYDQLYFYNRRGQCGHFIHEMDSIK